MKYMISMEAQTSRGSVRAAFVHILDESNISGVVNWAKSQALNILGFDRATAEKFKAIINVTVTEIPEESQATE